METYPHFLCFIAHKNTAYIVENLVILHSEKMERENR